MSNKVLIFYSLFIFAILFNSCKNDPVAGNQQEISFKLIRFEKLLMEMDTIDIKKSFQELNSSYPEFVNIYFGNVLTLSGFAEKNEDFFFSLKEFVTDSRIREIYKLTQEQYASFNEEKVDLEKAFSNANIYFPDAELPNIYTYISEFSLQRFIFEDGMKDGLGIGLDLFLGEDFDYARLEQGSNVFSKYLSRTYNKEHLVKKVMEAWIEDNMGLQTGNRLIDQMMYNGKKSYLLKNIIEVPDTILLEYTDEQYTWLSENESPMWAFLLERDWFYTTDQYVIKRLCFPAPNSEAIGMPTSAPGQTGNYLGLKIIESYMKRHPETGTSDLLSMDAQKLLEKSKFKPGR